MRETDGEVTCAPGPVHFPGQVGKAMCDIVRVSHASAFGHCSKDSLSKDTVERLQ
jgi:hypothetical protein